MHPIRLVSWRWPKGTTIAPLSMVFGCGALIDILPCGSALLEDSLAFIGSVEDQQAMAPQSALVHHPKDLLRPWSDSTILLQRCEDIILSFGSNTPVILDSPSALVHPILWRPPDKGITLVEVIRGIGT